MAPSEWERLTPSELRICAEAWQQRRQDEQSLLQKNIYSLAALIRVAVWSKSMPGYESVYGENAKGKMTDEQMYENVRAINRLFGGTEEE